MKKRKIRENIEIIVLLIVLALICVYTTIQSTYFYPLTSQDALEQCINRNFDYAEDFTQIPFTTQALGVKCGKINERCFE